MIYGNAGNQMSLDEALNYVRGLRTQVDVCLFMEDLVEVGRLLAEGNGTLSPVKRKYRPRQISDPRTPCTPMDWLQVSKAGECYVELKVLQETWRSVRKLEGGQQTFGLALINNLIVNSSPNVCEHFKLKDLDQLADKITHMLHQLVWCLKSHNMNKIIAYHSHLNLQEEDFSAWKQASAKTMREMLHLSEEAIDEWNKFWHVLFNRWLNGWQPETPALEPLTASSSYSPPTDVNKKATGLDSNINEQTLKKRTVTVRGKSFDCLDTLAPLDLAAEDFILPKQPTTDSTTPILQMPIPKRRSNKTLSLDAMPVFDSPTTDN